jgi:sec-independent protein translocase protein TatA
MELGMGEILVIVVLVLLFFGPSKLPQLGESLGRGIRNFKKASTEPDEPAASGAEREVSALPAHTEVRSTSTEEVAARDGASAKPQERS